MVNKKTAASPKQPQIRQASFGGGWVLKGGGVYCRHIHGRNAPWYRYSRDVLPGRLGKTSPLLWQVFDTPGFGKNASVAYMTTFLKVASKVPALLVISAIWVLSSQSILPVPKGIFGFDKFQHLLAYLVLAASFVFWFSPDQRRFHRLRTFLLLVFVSSLYGVIDELHQFYVPGRDCNVWDWIADTLGAFLGAGAALLADRLALLRWADG